MKTRKIFALLTVLALLFSCAALAEGGADDVEIGTYTIYNKTGETVVEVKITDNVTGIENVFPAEGEGGSLLNDNMITMIVDVPTDGTGSHGLTLSFKTESGREESFPTLHVEEVAIDLLAADAMTGATPIAFREAEKNETTTGEYTFYNKTGETVLFLNLIENVENGLAQWINFDPGFAPDTQKEFDFSVPAERKDTTLTLQFVTESGKIGIFNTLKIEKAPITLLEVDAFSGATPISFTAPQK